MGKKGAKREFVNNNSNQSSANACTAKQQHVVAKSPNEEGGQQRQSNSVGAQNSVGNLKSFEHLFETLIQTQNQCRDDQIQRFTQLEVHSYIHFLEGIIRQSVKQGCSRIFCRVQAIADGNRQNANFPDFFTSKTK